MIKIPEKHYVGLRTQSDSKLPLAFATPYEDNAAFRKRQETVDRWTKDTYRNQKHLPTRIVDNELVEGFRIAEDIRRVYWGGGNVVWRIEDPRGYELEIPSSNLARILDCTTVVNGVIQGKCIWGREGAQNLLLPENSEPYKEATVNTARSKLSVSTKEIAAGDTVLLKDGSEMLFLGLYYVVTTTDKQNHYSNSWNDRGYEYEYTFGVIKKRFMYYNVKKEEILATADTKNIASVVSKGEKDFDRVAWTKKVNKLMLDVKSRDTWAPSKFQGNVDTPIFATHEVVTPGDLSFDLVPGDIHDVKKKSSWRRMLTFANENGAYYRFYEQNSASKAEDVLGYFERFDAQSLLKGKFGYRYSYSHHPRTYVKYTTKQDVPWVKFVVKFKDQEYPVWM